MRSPWRSSRDLSDDQKLALPAFTQQLAGLRIGTRDIAFGHEPALDAALVYEMLVIAPEQPAQPPTSYTMPAAVSIRPPPSAPPHRRPSALHE